MFCKKAILIFLFFMSLYSAFSQKADDIIAKAVYKATFTKDGALFIDDVCHLDITKTQSIFFSQTLYEIGLERQRIFDKAKLNGTRPTIDGRNLPSRAKTYKAYNFKSYNDKKNIIVQAIGFQMLGYSKDLALYKNWEILPDTQTIANLKCQKAIIAQDDVVITAWFCKDLPFSDGPFSNVGLPGLIVKSTATNGWESELISFTQNKDTNRKIIIPEFVLISEADFKKAVANANGAGGNRQMPSGLKMEKKQN